MNERQLIVIRGNSGSGKTSIALALRRHYGRGLAWVSQDVLRREILREHDRAGAANIGLIDQVARYALTAGYHVVLDGILNAGRYEQMLAALHRDHDGPSRFYYLDISLEETLRRHQTRQMPGVTAADLRSWYEPRDLLATITERVIPEASALEETVSSILADTRLLSTELIGDRQSA